MGTGTAELDRATVALRRLLGRASDEDQARVEALSTLGTRLLLAPTWSPQDAALRTLTNAAGETAMPLFTADDTLQAAALRFQWLLPDGSLSFRELPAREAIRHALARGVHFVVLDLGSEHAAEFVREELAPLLTAQAAADGRSADERTTGRIGRAVRSSTRPPRRAGDSFAPPAEVKVPGAAPMPRGLGLDLDAPFGTLDAPFKRDSTRESPAPAPAPARREAQGSRDRRTEDRVPVVVREERPFAAPSRDRRTEDRVPVVVREERPFGAGARERERGESTTGVARRAEAFPSEAFTQEVPSVPPRKPSEVPAAAPHAPSKQRSTLASRIDAALPEFAHDELPNAPAAQAVPAQPAAARAAATQAAPEKAAPARAPAAQAEPEKAAPARAPAVQPAPEKAAPAQAAVPAAFELPTLPDSDASALRAEPVSARDTRDGVPAPVSLGRDAKPMAEARPEALEAAALVTELARNAGDADAREAAEELAAMLKASAAGEEEPAADAAKGGIASQLAAMWSSAKAAKTPKAAPAATRRTLGAGAAPATGTQAAAAHSRDDEEGAHDADADAPAEKRAVASGLRRADTPLADALVDLLADRLRGYPEVEWACEAADDGELPVIGLRVDPSFLSRVAEITEALSAAGTQQGTALSVVLLTDPEKMKRARNLQTVFYPGRRRTKR